MPLRQVIAVAMLITVVLVAPTSGQTLGDVLRKEAPRAPAPPADVQSAITSYSIANDASSFIIGFYKVDAMHADRLQGPLRVLFLDKQTGTWQHQEIQGRTASEDGPENFCAGSVLGIQAKGGWIYLETHLSPSAGCTFVLTPKLEIRRILLGWPIAFFSSGRVILQGNTVHFAMTHPLKVMSYDPSADVEIALLPREEDKILKQTMDDLSRLADESWCRENNSSCDPEDLSGSPQVVVNDITNTVAVRVVYSGEGYGPRAEGFQAEVVYIFDLKAQTIRYRQFRSDELKKLVGSYTLDDLTQADFLRRLFPQ